MCDSNQAIVVASDNSSQKWQDIADFHCKHEPDDAVVLRAAAEAAADAKESVIVAPGYYGVKSCWDVPAEVTGVRGAGNVFLLPRDGYDGYMMHATGLRRFAAIEGIGFNGKGTARGLLVDDCHDIIIERLHFSGTKQALKVEKGWYVHLSVIRASYCQGGTEPLVELNGFSMSSVRGLTINRCSANAPMFSARGTATYDNIGIEKCESVDSPIIRISGTHHQLTKLHFEENRAPIQVEAVDARQCELGGFSFAGPRSNPVNVGVQLTRCRDTKIDGVLATFCRNALVRMDYESGLTCTPQRLGFHLDDRKSKAYLPERIVDWVGQEVTTETGERE